VVTRSSSTLVLLQHCLQLAQCSSIGSLGPSKQWLDGQLTSSLCRKLDSFIDSLIAALSAPTLPIKLIYPSVESVRQSYEGYAGSGSLPYRMTTHVKQTYIKACMHESVIAHAHVTAVDMYGLL